MQRLTSSSLGDADELGQAFGIGAERGRHAVVEWLFDVYICRAAAARRRAGRAPRPYLTERLQAERMTVVGVDQTAGRFLCAEHRRWTPVVKADLRDVRPGDIVRVERATGKPAHIVVVRTGVDEIASPE